MHEIKICQSADRPSVVTVSQLSLKLYNADLFQILVVTVVVMGYTHGLFFKITPVTTLFPFSLTLE